MSLLSSLPEGSSEVGIDCVHDGEVWARGGLGFGCERNWCGGEWISPLRLKGAQRSAGASASSLPMKTKRKTRQRTRASGDFTASLLADYRHGSGQAASFTVMPSHTLLFSTKLLD